MCSLFICRLKHQKSKTSKRLFLAVAAAVDAPGTECHTASPFVFDLRRQVEVERVPCVRDGATSLLDVGPLVPAQGLPRGKNLQADRAFVLLPNNHIRPPLDRPGDIVCWAGGLNVNAAVGVVNLH
ncbi:hypothetical protein MLD38_032790 [Melastoma candidum]|uniref:Uncharacterized protein n=1 Tax=Melastoma candidum TaxID=119954 RepID=A0ACB9M8D6_9MYRT|nr:hypothetical protein MLD38_032790 [Melastoma candidum]